MTGKILSDAGWAVPDSLKQAMTEALQAPPPDMEGGSGKDLVSSLLEVADEVGQNPFAVYEYLNSLSASELFMAQFELIFARIPVLLIK